MNDIRQMTGYMRKKIIEMAYHAGKNGAHLGAALSCVEILACLYGKVMDISLDNINCCEHDVFIPSKAHCVLSYYSALAYVGFLTEDELNTFDENMTMLPGHPIRNEGKGIEFSGGSLGMGLSLGVGIALGMKRNKLHNRVFVLLGDGECDEGANWEAIQSAAHFGLDNLVVIVDANKLQYDGYTSDIMDHIDLKNKFDSFGFVANEVDGHSIDELMNIFMNMDEIAKGKPMAIIANTVKGKGVSFMENQKQWHHAVMSEEQRDMALKEVRECYGDK